MVDGLVPSLDEMIVALEGGPWYRRAEIARLLDVTPSAILEISRSPLHPELQAQSYVEWAGKPVHLWHESAVELMRAHFGRVRAGVGRPRIWTPAETADRRRRGDLVRYYRRSARRHRAAGDTARADKAQLKSVQIQRELDSQLEGRKSDLEAERAVNAESDTDDQTGS